MIRDVVCVLLLAAIVASCTDAKPKEAPEPPGVSILDWPDPRWGKQLVTGQVMGSTAGCGGCHRLDGTSEVAPTFRGMWGRLEAGETRFADGTTLREQMGPGKRFQNVEHYIRLKTLTRGQPLVAGYRDVAPAFVHLTEREMQAILAYLKTL